MGGINYSLHQTTHTNYVCRILTTPYTYVYQQNLIQAIATYVCKMYVCTYIALYTYMLIERYLLYLYSKLFQLDNLVAMRNVFSFKQLDAFLKLSLHSHVLSKGDCITRRIHLLHSTSRTPQQGPDRKQGRIYIRYIH